MAQAGFLFNGNGYFVVGSDGRTVTDFQKFPFKGWVDELRVYTGGIRNIPEDNYLYESICNLAMGSLVKINDMDYYRPAHPKLKLLADAAVKYGLLGLAKPIFNDPNIISTVGPVQGGTTIATKPILTNINLVPVGGTNPPSTVVTRPNLNNVNLIAVNSGTTTSTSTPVQYVAKNIPFVLVKNKIPTLINTNTTDSSGRSAASTPSNTSTESNTGSSTTQARMMSQTNAPRGLTGVYVCEQLDYTVNNYPSEIAPQDMTNILCATRVHRNPHTNAMIASKCARKVVLGIKNSPIKHGFARPDFSQNQFCLSCHMDSNENPALKMEALESYPNILRQEDERRQPMDHIPFVSGCTPVNIPSLTAANGSYCAPSGADLYLDQIFDFQGKIRPYGK
jgi:hypothetical protein